jgi:hypothetical protein
MTYANAFPAALPTQVTKTTSAPSPEIPPNNKFIPRDLKFKPIPLS